MSLPEDDERYLTEKGFDWVTVPNGNGIHLIIRGYPLDTSRYDRDATDIMLIIPSGYPQSPLDMFYADPWIKLRTGADPPQASVVIEAGPRRWQRFSRHLPQPWRVGIDGLHVFLAMIAAELQPRNS
jgi:hypothetical protein